MYDITTGIISQPVSIYDLRMFFGLSSTDLATLITQAHINMWAGDKPVYQTKISQLTSGDRYGRGLSGYKTGGGIKKRAYAIADYKTSMDSNGNPTSQLWEYDRPVSGSAFRLTDFAGYHHLAQRKFTLFSYIKNLANIPIPSSTGGSGGVNIEFRIIADFETGCVSANELLADCIYNLPNNVDFYPAVIMTCSSGQYHYAKTADDPIQSYIDSNGNLNAPIIVNTASFAAAIASDANGYSKFPLRSRVDNWTSCIALISRKLTGDSATANHNLNANDTIVRLEYEANCDRWTLPVVQGKYTIVQWIKMSVTITKQGSSGLVYKITNITLKTKKSTASDLTFLRKAQVSCYVGQVTLGGQTIQDANAWNDFGGSTVVQGASGAEVTQTLTNIPDTIYTVTGTYTGNQQCSFTLKLTYQSGNNVYEFAQGITFDVHDSRQTYTQSNVELL